MNEADLHKGTIFQKIKVEITIVSKMTIASHHASQ